MFFDKLLHKFKTDDFSVNNQDNVIQIDPYFYDVAMLCIDKNKASVDLLQKYFKIGYDRASKIIDQLTTYGVISSSPNSSSRKILMSCDDFDNLYFEIINNNYTPPDYVASANQLSPCDEQFDNMTGIDFEYFCADLLKKNNFINVSVTQKSADHGIDIFAEKDDISYAIQCKCYSSNIGNAAIQQAHTGKCIFHKDIAVVFTNQYFTAQAITEAEALGVKLWDRDKLQKMLHYN